MFLLALVAVSHGQLYRVEYIYGSPNCEGEVFSILSRYVVPPTSVCQAHGCANDNVVQTASSYVTCQSAPLTPPAQMRCGVDTYSNSDCSGIILSQQRVALGVCVRDSTGSRIYTDCELNGKPSTYESYVGNSCQGQSLAPNQIDGRTCTGGECSNGIRVLCNRVLGAPPPVVDCITSPDVNGDGQVNLFDVLFLLNVWGVCGSNLDCNRADLNCDGSVDLREMQVVIGAWTG